MKFFSPQELEFYINNNTGNTYLLLLYKDITDNLKKVIYINSNTDNIILDINTLYDCRYISNKKISDITLLLSELLLNKKIEKDTNIYEITINDLLNKISNLKIINKYLNNKIDPDIEPEPEPESEPELKTES
jgi:hypothetical protein